MEEVEYVFQKRNTINYMLFTCLAVEGGLVICACSRRKLLDPNGHAIRIHKKIMH